MIIVHQLHNITDDGFDVLYGAPIIQSILGSDAIALIVISLLMAIKRGKTGFIGKRSNLSFSKKRPSISFEKVI